VSIAVSNEAELLTGMQLEFPKVFTLLASLQPEFPMVFALVAGLRLVV
jgi:hypothetical protein